MSLEIQLSEEYRITADKRQFIMQRFITPKPKEGDKPKDPYWKSETFHNSLDGLLVHYAQMSLRLSDVKSLAMALKEMKNIVSTLSGALNPQFEVKTK